MPIFWFLKYLVFSALILNSFKSVADNFSFFYSHARFTSHIEKISQAEYNVIIRGAGESYNFQIKNGTINEAKIEKRYKKFKVIGTFIFFKKHYWLTNLIVTNRFRIASNGSCGPTKVEGNENDDYLQATANAIVPPQLPINFLGESCDKLAGNDRKELDKLKNLFNDENDLHTHLLSCLKNSENLTKFLSMTPNSKGAQVSDMKNAVRRVAAALADNVSQIKNNKNSISIECEQDPNPKQNQTNKKLADYEDDKGKIDFFVNKGSGLDEEDHLLEENNRIGLFVHEFVHLALSKPQQCRSQDSESYAKAISKICFNYTLKNSGGSELVDPSIKEVQTVAQDMPKQVTNAINQTPEQKVDPQTFLYLVNLPENSLPGADTGAALQAAFAPTTKTFSRLANTMAEAFVPTAEAQSIQREPPQRKIASSSETQDSVKSYSASPDVVNNVEDYFVAAPTDTNSTTVNLTRMTAQYFPPLGPKAAQLVKAATTPDAPSRGPANFTGPTNSPIVTAENAGTSFERDIQRTQANEVNVNPANHKQVYNVAGILFTDKSVTGVQYRAYRQKMKENPTEFKQLLSKQGILIFKDGKNLTSPISSDLVYEDTGTALIVPGKSV